MTGAYCLAHGLITLHVATEVGEQVLPAALYKEYSGAAALQHGGPRAQRVARWDTSGWDTWWAVLSRYAAGRPAVAAVPPLDREIPPDLPTVHVVPASVAVRAACPLDRGLALYLGAFALETARFSPEGMAEPQALASGLDPLYRAVVADLFRRQHRVLLPAEVPALFQEGHPPDVAPLLESVAPLLDGSPVALGGEDDAVVAAVAAALRQQGHEVVVVDPLAGLELLVRAIGGFP